MFATQPPAFNSSSPLTAVNVNSLLTSALFLWHLSVLHLILSCRVKRQVHLLTQSQRYFGYIGALCVFCMVFGCCRSCSLALWFLSTTCLFSVLLIVPGGDVMSSHHFQDSSEQNPWKLHEQIHRWIDTNCLISIYWGSSFSFPLFFPPVCPMGNTFSGKLDFLHLQLARIHSDLNRHFSFPILNTCWRAWILNNVFVWNKRDWLSVEA